MKKWIATGALAAGAVWFFLRSQPEESVDAPTGQASLRSGGTANVAAPTTPQEIKPSRPRLLDGVDTAELNPDAGVDSAGSEPSVAGQIQAMHAMGAQADVSLFLEKNAELAAKWVDKFCEDSKALEKPWKTNGPPTRDGASFMVGRVDWTTVPPILGSLHLSDAVMERVKSTGDDWASALGVGDLAGLDFGWMAGLRAYDAWSLGQLGPLATNVETDVFDAPLPNYIQLMAWSKLRLVRGLQLGDLMDAIEDVRHLSQVLHTQGILIAEVVSVKLVEFEHDAFRAARALGKDTAGWTPTVKSDFAPTKTLLKAAPSFLFPGVDPKVMEKAAQCAPAPCSAITEAAAMHAAIGAEAPTNTSEAFWKLARAKSCDASLLKVVERANPTTPVKARAALLSGPSFLENAYGPKP